MILLVIILFIIFLLLNKSNSIKQNVEHLQNIEDRLSEEELLDESYEKCYDKMPGYTNKKSLFENDNMMVEYNNQDVYHLLKNQSDNNILNNDVPKFIENNYKDKRIKYHNRYEFNSYKDLINSPELYDEKSKLGLNKYFDTKLLDGNPLWEETQEKDNLLETPSYTNKVNKNDPSELKLNAYFDGKLIDDEQIEDETIDYNKIDLLNYNKILREYETDDNIFDQVKDVNEDIADSLVEKNPYIKTIEDDFIKMITEPNTL